MYVAKCDYRFFLTNTKFKLENKKKKTKFAVSSVAEFETRDLTLKFTIKRLN